MGMGGEREIKSEIMKKIRSEIRIRIKIRIRNEMLRSFAAKPDRDRRNRPRVFMSEDPAITLKRRYRGRLR